ncbi:hypothetical protein [Neorhizobium galegae]|uniref:hypothetical protein n=1 Tax=Neorhizobium galegae TaxID=399 RepID=UPI000621056A|nr:hypothetical protein [Neorhizobium galegae]CDZ29373.1 Hypothetical protein NGAL_HAMBI490_42390 [Neorhizobium galegae bv. officinalis]KAA9386437.1 hypothetical protein F4V88_08120 [Neorhizobium galegae]KAB1112708.1 hypothetical protein F4V89_14845 [Neorhizobium galegae]MCM2500639.1 hypothetical protein [Neorhizobium galegae]MCQ1764668.1 hypothetical protein [Neorhizobium galegae]
MSKIAAIDAAIRLQLAEDGKTIGRNDALVGATGYGNAAEVEEFLLKVARRLRLDTPVLRFAWTDIKAADITASRFHIVHERIFEKTTVEKSDD